VAVSEYKTDKHGVVTKIATGEKFYPMDKWMSYLVEYFFSNYRNNPALFCRISEIEAPQKMELKYGDISIKDEGNKNKMEKVGYMKYKLDQLESLLTKLVKKANLVKIK
jgi:hypothetical protein